MLVLFSFFSAVSQTRQIDSLRLKMNSEKQDTNFVKDLNELAWQFLDYSGDSSQKYVQKALQFATDQRFVNGIIEAKNTLGILYRYSGESEKAIQLYNEIIRLRKEQGRLDKLTGAYSNLGSVYYEKGDNATAIKYYLIAYKNAESLRQAENQMILLNNLGAAYKTAGLTDQSIEAFKKGLQLNKAFNNEFQEAQFHLNLATVYDQQALYDEALRYEELAYAIYKKTKSTRQLATILNNLSLTTRHLKDYKASETYLNEMRSIADELKEASYYEGYHQSKANFFNDQGKMREALKEVEQAISFSDSSTNLGAYGTNYLIKANIQYNLKNCAEALKFYDLGISCVSRLDDKHAVAKAYKGKAAVVSCLGDFLSASRYYQRADEMLDSLNAEAFNTKMATLNSLNELDKKEKELQLSIKEKENAEAKNKQQAQFLVASIIIGLLVVVFLVFSVRAYRIKKKDNELLNNQKREIELKNQTLHQQKLEIEGQKTLVEEKQGEILDSIHYAKRIQRALLANHDLINRHLPDNFVLFKPKAIVSGDFYWATEKNDCFYLAICDSTGHGVPGAFMSLLNISFLNEAINEKNITSPDKVFDHVRKKLIENISQEGAKDGMDGILICLDKKKSILTYAAAYNRPILVNAEKIQEFPADKMPVGLGESSNPFSLHTIDFKKGDTLYLYSDGYADQFGGPGGKKFKYKALQALLLQHAHLALSEQHRLFETAFESWRGQLEQVDDVLLVGIRL